MGRIPQLVYKTMMLQQCNYYFAHLKISMYANYCLIHYCRCQFRHLIYTRWVCSIYLEVSAHCSKDMEEWINFQNKLGTCSPLSIKSMFNKVTPSHTDHDCKSSWICIAFLSLLGRINRVGICEEAHCNLWSWKKELEAPPSSHNLTFGTCSW